MLLADWARLRQRAVLDVDYYTISRGWDQQCLRLKYFVVLSNPIPYQVRVFSSLAQVANFLERPMSRVAGLAFTEGDYFERLTF